jgi:hypothetical protein
LLPVALMIFPSSNSSRMFSNFVPAYSVGVLYWMTPCAEFLTGQENTSPSGMFRLPSASSAPMPLMLKRRSVPGAFDVDAVGAVHALLQGQHGPRHFRVIHCADVEVKILERLGAHAGPLGHARAGPAQHAPARLVDAVIHHRTHRLGISVITLEGTSEDSLALLAPRTAM